MFCDPDNCLVLLFLGWPFIFCAIKNGKQITASTNNLTLSSCFLPAYLWQLMRFSILRLLKNLRCQSQGKEISDADILNWANNKVKKSGKTTQMESFKVLSSIAYCSSFFLFCWEILPGSSLNIIFLSSFPLLFSLSLQDKSLSNGIFFLELLSAVKPRVINWKLVTKGEDGMLFSHHIKSNICLLPCGKSSILGLWCVCLGDKTCTLFCMCTEMKAAEWN